MKGAGFVADGWTTNSVTTAQMKKTSNSVPMNSARYAAGPRSCTLRPPEIGEFLPVGFDAVRRILLAISVSISLAGCGDDGGRERATLALDFQPNSVHAGIYAALREDLDAERDLDLRLRVPSASTDSLKLLAAGRADVSVVDIHDLGLARQEGEPIVGVGALVQRPLAAVIARREPIRRPRDLEGRRVGVTGLPSDDAVLRAVVEADGGDFDRVERVTIGFSAVPSLIAERVDAVVSFWNAEGVALRQRGVPTREFRVDDYGAPRYPELVLVTEARTWREERGPPRGPTSGPPRAPTSRSGAPSSKPLHPRCGRRCG